MSEKKSMMDNFNNSKTRKYFESIGKWCFYVIAFCCYFIVMGYVELFKIIMNKIDNNKKKKEVKDGISTTSN